MSKRTFVYDPEKVILQMGGVYLTGFSDGGKVVIEQNEDDVLPKVGVDGSVHYSINHNKTALAKIPLMSTSPLIPYIRGLTKDNEEFNFTMVDMNDNGENISCDECRIIKTPDYSRQKEAEEVEFEVFIPFLK